MVELLNKNKRKVMFIDIIISVFYTKHALLELKIWVFVNFCGDILKIKNFQIQVTYLVML
jgi:hypothetical protein